MMIAGIALAPAILTAMSTPEDVMDLSVLYIRIYFVGMIGNLLYNMGSGILRAVGDSKRPLYFLIISCFVNILLDVFFVAVLQMGVAGAAVATILSQAVSAGLVVAALMRTKDMHRLSLKKLCFDTRMFRRIIRIGFPAGLQSIMYSFSNIVIQASINGLGTNTAAAWTAYCKIDCMNWMTINAFGIAITTFVGQNYGAGREDRARRGMVTCLGMSYGSTILISILLYTFGGYVVRLFSTDPEVLEISKSILRFLVPIYFTYTAVEILSGTLRGVGDTWVPMILCCVGICLIRLVWIWTVVPYHQNIYAITVSYPITWTVTSIMFIIYYRYFSRMKKVKLTA
jgi:putative MATE family efflux protein